MYKSRRLLILALAVAAGAGPLLTAYDAFAQDNLVPMCFRGRTIQVPFYLRPRYLAAGAMDNPCPASQ